MHILMTMYGWAEEGGGTVLPRQMAKALVRRGHRVTVVYTPIQVLPDKPAYHVVEGRDEGVRLFGVFNRPAIFYDTENPEREIDDPPMNDIVSRLAAALRPDIVHYHSFLNFSLGVPEALHQLGIPGVYTSHNYWPLCPSLYLIRSDFSPCPGPGSDGSACASCIGRLDKKEKYSLRARRARETLDRCVDLHLAPSRRVRELFIQNGYDPSRIQVLRQQPESLDWIREYARNSGRLRKPASLPLKIGFFGSIIPIKGVHVLARAIQVFHAGQIECRLFGRGPDAYLDVLKQMDLNHLLRFQGYYEPRDAPGLLEGIDLAVLPSIVEETGGLVVMEALAARVPVIASRIGGLPELVEPGVNGFLFEPGAHAQLSAVLRSLVDNPGIVDRLRRNIVAPKSFDDFMDELIGHYNHVTGARRGAENSPARPASPAVRPAVRWEGLQFVHHSMALINRELCLRLIDAGCELSIIKFVPEEFGPGADPRFPKLAARELAPLSRPAHVHVRHYFSPDFTPPPEGRWVIIQPWEYGRLPEDWIAPMSRIVDEIWVPSRYVLKSYLASGVPADRVHVVPNGVNVEIFRPGAPPYPLPTRKKFKFLFVGGTIWRKGVDILLKAYREAFGRDDDVTLVIKEMGQDKFYQGQGLGATIAAFNLDPLAPELLHITEMLDESRMPGLYAACNCLVHPYRGEGFALPVLEAMACRLPVMVTEGGATDDFCSDETALLIPASLKGFKHTTERLAGGIGWVLEPDAESLVKLLRYAAGYENALKEKTGPALRQVMSGFTWDRIGETVLSRIEGLMKKPIRRFD